MLFLQLLYLLASLFTAALCLISHIPAPATLSHKNRTAWSILGSLITEFPQIFLVVKLLIIKAAWSAQVLDGRLGGWLYRVDVGVILAIWGFFLQGYFARFVVEEQTKCYRVADSHDPPEFFTIAYFLRLLNPFWTARNVMVHPDIVYATDEELKAAGPASESMMSLDVHIHPSYPRKRPVLIYVHGGFWQSGDKTVIPPFVSYLALKRWVVVSVNHRTSPHAQYPEHVRDVKRAIRWVRANIERYGGDPSFIAVSGSGSGGHIASVVAMSANDPFYQPGFEDVDTEVHACVAINALFDLTNSRRMWKVRLAEWFAKRVAGAGEKGVAGVDELLKSSSPLLMLKALEADKRKSGAPAAVPEEKEGEQVVDKSLPAPFKSAANLVPFLVF
ncbi:Alpha/Beta hydrolase protein, partial [Blyttiomyces helicus]